MPNGVDVVQPLNEEDVVKRAEEMLDNLKRKDYKLSEAKEIEDRTELEESLRLDLSDAARKRLEKELHQAIDQDLKDMADKFEKWDFFEELFDGIVHESNFPWPGHSNLHIPLTKIKVKKCTSRTKRGLITNVEPIWTITPREQADVGMVGKMERFIHYSATVEMEIDVPLSDVFESAAKLGTGILEIPYVWEVETVSETGKYDGNKIEDVAKFLARYPDAKKKYPEYHTRLFAGEELELEEEWDDEIYRGPMPEYVERRKFITPKGYNSLKKMPRYFKEIELSWDDLQDGIKEGKYEEEQIDRLKFRRKKGGGVTLLKATEYTNKKYRAFEGMYKCDPKTDEGSGTRMKCLFTYIYDEQIIIRGIKYQYRHGRPYFVAYRIMRNPNDFDGRSLAEEVADLNIEMNITHNNAIDNDTIRNTVSFKQLRSSTINLNIERWFPGKHFTVDKPDELQEVIMSPSHPSSFSFEALAMKYADLVTGIPEYMAGGAETKDPKAPAKKAEILLGEAQIDIADYIHTLRRGMKETGFIIGQLFLQYGTKGKEYRVLNEKGEPAFEPAPSREDMRLRADFEPMGSVHTVNKIATRQTLWSIIPELLKEPLIANYTPGRKILVQEILKHIPEADLDKKIHQILPDDNTIREWNIQIQMEALRRLVAEQQKAQMQAQKMAGGAGI